MKKRIILLGLLLVMVFGLFGTFTKAEDTTTATPVATDTSVGTLFLAKPTVDATINHEGDVFAAGQNVSLKGKIIGNLFVAGNNVTLPKDLEVRGSVFAAGQSVKSEAMVYGQVYLAGQNITDSSEVVGDIKAAGATILLSGKYNYAYLGGQNSTFSGTANYGLRMAGETSTITDEAKITGNIKIDAREGKTPTISETYKDKAEVRYSKAKDPDDKPLGKGNIWMTIVGFLFSFVLGIAMMYIFPQAFEKIKANFTKKTWFALLWGFLSILIVPLCALLIFLFFIPASIVFVIAGVFFWLVTFLFGSIVIYFWFGEIISKLFSKEKPMHPVLVLLIGTFVAALIYFLLSLIPFVGMVGCLLKCVVGLFGSGAVILAIFTRETPA